MRTIWVQVDPWDQELVTTALEGGADGILVPKEFSDKVKELGRIKTIAPDGDLVIGKDVVLFKIQSGADEDQIVKLCQDHQVILECTDWSIIPLENLIAKGAANIIARVTSLEEARTAFGILEKGVESILLEIKNALELKQALAALRFSEMSTILETAVIESIRALGMGDRVCVDTCTSMLPGQGMLVGNSSSALFLIHAESISNPYVAPRPFRINAGPVHAYMRVPGGRTRYLSELISGDEVLIVDYQGQTTIGIVGRVKVEKRPLILVTARYKESKITTILQNAETIRLTSPEGEPLSVVALKPGDKIMAAVESGARHFGHKIEETITEK